MIDVELGTATFAIAQPSSDADGARLNLLKRSFGEDWTLEVIVMQYSVIVEDGEITIPASLVAELGWRTGDDLLIDSTEAGIAVRRPPDAQPDV